MIVQLTMSVVEKVYQSRMKNVPSGLLIMSVNTYNVSFELLHRDRL